MYNFTIGDIRIYPNNPLVLIAGPCVIESEEHTMFMAWEIKKIADYNKVPFIFKSSFEKANRTKVDSYRGPGLTKGIQILNKVKNELEIPVTADVHESWQVSGVDDVLDMIQIPAFLCRQTKLIEAAAGTGLPVNVKRGQFLSPAKISHVRHKAGDKCMITERGYVHGYDDLVVDMRSIDIMKRVVVPIVFDATHSAGDRAFVYPLSRAAVAVGVNAIFMEVHNSSETALCDAESQISLGQLETFLPELRKIDELIKRRY